jgi:hypothetical protein
MDDREARDLLDVVRRMAEKLQNDERHWRKRQVLSDVALLLASGIAAMLILAATMRYLAACP